MLDVIDFINFAIAIAGITISMQGCLLIFFIPFMEKRTKPFFLLLFSLLVAYASSDLLSMISLKFLGSNFTLLSKIAIFLESLFSSMLMPLLTVLILRLTGEKIKSRFLYVILILWSVYLIILLITQFTTDIYYFTSDNVYHRGPYYPVLLAPPILLMVANLIGLIKRKSIIPKERFKVLLTYLLLPTLAMIIQMFSYGILIIVLASSISSLILFVNALNEAAEKYVSQKMKINEQELRAKTLQIRPHFIYNTLSNIYYLCEIDPSKAQRVVDSFTIYLKKNFSAISQSDLIRFEEELIHTKAYLEVVKARYENLLFVDYDIQNKSFKPPPLTLEPLVENAVRHGLDPESSSLHIWIRTLRDNNDNIIIVENNGVDFPESEIVNFSHIKDSRELHVGLGNVSSRLKALCGGSLDIGKRAEGGTIAIIRIPINS